MLLVSAGRVGVPARVSSSTDDADRLESLRSIPYLSWTDEDADESLSGVTIYDPDRAFPGHNFFSNDVDTVYLVDMAGDVLHSWVVPGGTRCKHAEMLRSGEMLVLCARDALVRLDWNSEVIWRLDRDVHHDVAVHQDGSILVPIMTPAIPYKFDNRVKFDSVERYSAEGRLLDSWSSFDQLELLQEFHPPSPLDDEDAAQALKARQEKKDARKRKKGGKTRKRSKPFDYYHLNSVEFLPGTPLAGKDVRFQAGNVLVSLRNTNAIVILDKDTLRPVWGWGPGELDWQHMPTMLENGNILIYDNGARRKYSRVIEIDPLEEEIVWQYQAQPPKAFFSKLRGSSQRLPNGNTLICESQTGRVFEVTAEGEIVWEFWNPEIQDGKRKRIYRFMRIPETTFEPYLEGFHPTGSDFPKLQNVTQDRVRLHKKSGKMGRFISDAYRSGHAGHQKTKGYGIRNP